MGDLQAKGQVFSGARARLYLRGKVIGYATNVSGTEEIQYEPVEVLNHMQVIEFVPVGYRVSLNASRVRLIGDGASNAGSMRGDLDIFPKMGQNDADLLANALALIMADDMTCMIEDTISSKRFMTLQSIVIPSRNFTITPRGIVGEDITILGIRALDEAEPGPA